ncbi:SAM-dependent methyltransferase [Streptomyces lavendulae]|uniref:Mg-protoporphyrin IX methyl transferase n=1 Tax=Streptomyces lavendulae subsp. lavendulae TaxID=58340 RepID=A0A2K8PJ72_STRLA|nr:class I SAM-dependent methyltransferase [Streptomyces lavendulae]ATZ26769.1 Mg-protoporphyrin IX methyl transferase [Streptomyces lavendulae subsp. lavendulae]QUQ56596.1 Ubiquinone biosynthesis O-methyltransferase, mitochondrial [Streptomyces lavendulae subsp. lavendulae]
MADHQTHEQQHEQQRERQHTPDSGSGRAYWDDRYRGSERIWSGAANAVLVRETADLAPGRALDLGCGEGGDAIWLARRGWRVTGTDISGVALERAAAHAAGAGVADRVRWERHDLAESFPDGEFDLVCACFLHTVGEFPRERVLRTAAAAVAPGGVLLVAGHAGWAPWQDTAAMDELRRAVRFPTPEQVVAELELPEGAWEVLLAEEHERAQDMPDGTPGTRTDNAVKVRRLV